MAISQKIIEEGAQYFSGLEDQIFCKEKSVGVNNLFGGNVASRAPDNNQQGQAQNSVVAFS